MWLEKNLLEQMSKRRPTEEKCAQGQTVIRGRVRVGSLIFQCPELSSSLLRTRESLSPGLDLPSSLPSPMLGSVSSIVNLGAGCNLPLWRNSSWTLLCAVGEKDLKRLRIILCGKASGPGISKHSQAQGPAGTSLCSMAHPEARLLCPAEAPSPLAFPGVLSGTVNAQQVYRLGFRKEHG